MFQQTYIILSLMVLMTTLSGMAGATETETPSQTTETYDDWVLRCRIDTSGEFEKSCEVSQTVQGPRGNVLARIALGRSMTAEKYLVVMQLPQGMLLADQPVLQNDEGTFRLLVPYYTCLQSVCLARAETTKASLRSVELGESGLLQLRNVSGAEVQIRISFRGLSAALAKFEQG